MNNHAPTREGVGNGWTPGWINWLQQVFQCLPWSQGISATATINFGAIAAQSQLPATVAVPRVRAGGMVHVTPMSDVFGLVFTGVVTANDTVTVYAKNISAVAVDPASQVFRIIVLN